MRWFVRTACLAGFVLGLAAAAFEASGHGRAEPAGLGTPINATFVGSGSGSEECAFSSGSQRIDYNVEVDVTVEAVNPVQAGDIISYVLTRQVGTVRFFGTAEDTFLGQTTILNFDRTQNIDLQGTGGDFELSANSCGGAYIAFPIPNAPPPPESIFLQYSDALAIVRNTVNMPFPWNAGTTCLGNNYDVPASLEIDDPGCALRYVAMGDSYSSGEGVLPFFDGTDVPDGNDCHRSERAYSTFVELPPQSISGSGPRTFLESRGEDFPSDFAACSGAVTSNVLSGQNGEPPQIDKVAESPDLISITIGGNDAGFSSILELCILQYYFGHKLGGPDCSSPDFRPFPEEVPLSQLLARRISRAAVGIDVVHRELSQAQDSSVFVLGYPPLFPADPVADDQCDDVPLTRSDMQLLRSATIALNQKIEASAGRAGLFYVPVDFSGHELCNVRGRVPYFHPLMPKAVRVFSFHPDRTGQLAYAVALNRAVQFEISRTLPENLLPSGFPRNRSPSSAVSRPSAQGADPDNPPTFGELDLDLTAEVGCLSRDSLVPGEDARLRAHGFAPSASVVVRFRAEDIDEEIAIVSADEAGTLDVVATIPSSAPSSGPAGIEGRGIGAEGSRRIVVALAEMVATLDADADDDGVPNICDNCQGVANNAQTDSDLDFSGDACDACPQDPANDADGDGFCEALDPCPFDELNDQDGDGVCGFDDNCPSIANPGQADADLDSFGNACDADLNQDLFVGGPDFDIFLSCFNQPTGPATGPPDDPTCGESDMNGDGFVGGPDFDLFLQGFNQAPGPSGQTGCGLGWELLLLLPAWNAIRRRGGYRS